MDEDLASLKKNKTWTITSLPKTKVVTGCKWVYKIKYNVDGTIDRYKTRLVAKNYTQLEGLDFIDAFSLIAKLITVRLLLSLVIIHN